jgi:nucleotide-binding universal stress UspA family protein
VNLRDLLVLLDTRPASAGRLEAALALASAFEAHLTALRLVGEPSVPLVELPPDALYRGQLEAEADRVLAEAVARAERAGVAIETRRETAVVDRLPERLVRQARHADLAILGQPEPDDPFGTGMRLVEAALLESGRPLLVVPWIGAAGLPPRRVLAAWDGSAPAARALGDSLPLLRRAERVTLVVVDPERLGGRVGEQPGGDMAAHLARHGVKVEVQAVPSGGLATADVLLDLAADTGAELLVMGGYGHSRLRELAFGGTTRDVLGRMTVPVLLAR